MDLIYLVVCVQPVRLKGIDQVAVVNISYGSLDCTSSSSNHPRSLGARMVRRVAERSNRKR